MGVGSGWESSAKVMTENATCSADFRRRHTRSSTRGGLGESRAVSLRPRREMGGQNHAARNAQRWPALYMRRYPIQFVPAARVEGVPTPNDLYSTCSHTVAPAEMSAGASVNVRMFCRRVISRGEA